MAPPKAFEYLYTHPQPCSLVVQSVNEKERHGQQAPAPKSKEAKCLDLFGRKIYSGGGLQLRAANQQALLSRYNYNTWNSMQKFREFVPQESRQEYSALIEEGKKVARTLLQASLDIADSAARTLASGVAMWRISWLQSSNLPPEVQYTIQDLPFNGQGLFSEKTDSKLQTLKDGRTIIRTLGMHTPATQRRPSRSAPTPRPGLDRTSCEDAAGVVGGGSRVIRLARTRAPLNHQRGPSKTFEVTPKDGAPVSTQDPSPLFRDRLSHFFRAWSKITSDRWVLRTVERGYHLQFVSFPSSHPPSLSLFRDPSHEQLLIQEVQMLLTIGVIEEVPREFRGKGFYSRYFLIPQIKRRATSYPGLARTQQIYGKVEVPHGFPGYYYPFPGDWYAALDMKDAYFHIAVYPPHRRFLRFVVDQRHFSSPSFPSAYPRHQGYSRSAWPL
ncbi:uncharacterized protein RBU57_004199 [Macrochelys suwanniensis]